MPDGIDVMRKRMTIYRIEDDEGRGPYRHPVYGYDDWHGVKEVQPRHGLGDEEMFFYRRMVFGFRSQRQLRRWFKASELKALYAAGFKLRTFRVSTKRISFGKAQVAFVKRKKRRTREQIEEDWYDSEFVRRLEQSQQ